MRSEKFETILQTVKESGRGISKFIPFETNAEMNREIESAFLEGYLEDKTRITRKGDWWWVLSDKSEEKVK